MVHNYKLGNVTPEKHAVVRDVSHHFDVQCVRHVRSRTNVVIWEAQINHD